MNKTAKEFINDLVKDLMNNPYVTPDKGKTKHQTAYDIAYNRYKQAYHNELALSLSIKKQGPPGNPPRPNLVWKPETHRWVSDKNNNPIINLETWKTGAREQALQAKASGNIKLYQKIMNRIKSTENKMDIIRHQ